jgi:PTS system mannose-specific IIA component
MIQGFLVTHGDLGRELLTTAELILGPIRGCSFVSNRGLTESSLVEQLEPMLEEMGEEPSIVFVDFFGGSCATACLRLLERHPEIYLIGGVNLPILLTFLNKRDQLGADELVEHILARGRDSVSLVKPGTVGRDRD